MRTPPAQMRPTATTRRIDLFLIMFCSASTGVRSAAHWAEDLAASGGPSPQRIDTCHLTPFTPAGPMRRVALGKILRRSPSQIFGDMYLGTG